MKKLPSKHTQILDNDYQRLAVNGLQMIQIQIEQDGDDAFIDLNRKEAKQLAQAILDHCKEAES